MGIFIKNPKFRPFAYLLLFFILCGFIPSAWKVVIQSSFNEFHAPLWEASSRISDLTDYWGHFSDSKKTLIEKGRDFQRISHDQYLQSSTLESQNKELNRLKMVQSELVVLQESLGLEKTKSFSPVISRITIRSITGWWQGFEIRKGRSNYLKDGMGVIFGGGVVGKLNWVGSNSSEVKMITNPSFRIVANFSGDERPVTFQGNGIAIDGSPQGIVFDVPQDIVASEKEPLLLVTTSLGGTFPDGLPIGRVFNLDGDKNGLFKSGQVFLDKKLNQLREVTILSMDDAMP